MNASDKGKIYENEATELLSALASARDLQDIVEAGETLFGNPLVITDHSWSVLAMSSKVEIKGDTAWNEFVHWGTLSIDTVSLNIRNKLTERIKKNDEPFIWQDSDKGHRRLLGKVFIGQRSMATVSVIELNDKFRESDIDRMKVFATAVSAEMQKDRYKKYSRGLLYEDFITGILNGAVYSPSFIRDRVQFFKIPLSKDLRLFVIDSQDFDDQDLSAAYVRDHIEKIMSIGMPIIYKGRVLSVKSYADGRDSFEGDIKALESFIVQNNIRCGVSRLAENLTRLPDIYREASAALRLGPRIKPEQSLYRYEEYMFYRMCEICDEIENGDAFLDASLMRLIAYDKKHGTEFTASLKGWLDFSRNISDAAAALHLHRNTLVYHLKRAEEIADICFTNPDKLMYLEVSFKLLEYRGESPV